MLVRWLLIIFEDPSGTVINNQSKRFGYAAWGNPYFSRAVSTTEPEQATEPNDSFGFVRYDIRQEINCIEHYSLSLLIQEKPYLLFLRSPYVRVESLTISTRLRVRVTNCNWMGFSFRRWPSTETNLGRVIRRTPLEEDVSSCSRFGASSRELHRAVWGVMKSMTAPQWSVEIENQIYCQCSASIIIPILHVTPTSSLRTPPSCFWS